MRLLTTAVCACLIASACDPVEDDGPGLGEIVGAPDIRVEVLADDPNFVVVEDVSEGFFSRVWELPGGLPVTSTERLDTIFYPSEGDYEIRLYASANGGGGTATAATTVDIAQDAANQCSDLLTLLAGGCEETSQKCWTFSRAAEAVRVGPVPGSGEWFRSNEEGLQAEQYDDAFCFSFSGSAFQYINNGLTVDPSRDFAPVPYEPLEGQTYQILPGAGEDGETRVQLLDGNFIGLLDAGTYFDIVTLTEGELVVRTPFLTPTDSGEGWFELTFVAL